MDEMGEYALEIVRESLLKNKEDIDNISKNVENFCRIDKDKFFLRYILQLKLNNLDDLCEGCSFCCRVPDAFLTKYDIERISKFLNIDERIFTNRFCTKKNDKYVLRKKENKCIFLKKGRCKIYKVRPTACVFFPFLIESEEEIYLPEECKSGVKVAKKFYKHLITEILRRYIIKGKELDSNAIKLIPFDERIVVLKHMFQIFMNSLPDLCNNCSKCCETLRIELTIFDIYRISQRLSMQTNSFLDKFCEKIDSNYVVLKKTNGKCPFLKNKRCTIYEYRPAVCVLYPFMVTEQLKQFDIELPEYCKSGRKVFDTFKMFLI